MEWIPLATLFFIGLSYGMTACTFACLPFLAPLLVKNSATLRQSLEVILPFSLGRITGYTALAVAASFSSGAVRHLLKSPEIAQALLGGSTVLIALYLLAESFKKERSCPVSEPMGAKRVTGKGGYFAVGAAMTLNPCAPVMTLIGFAVNTAGPTEALFMGLSFGLGAVLFSIFLYGFMVAKITGGIMAQFSGYRKQIERTAMIVLLLLGVLVLNGTVKF